MSAGLQSHPFAGLFPVLKGPELNALAADIRENGLHVPITLYEGRILDGRNRYLACERVGVAPRFEEWSGQGSPLAWVISANLHRRHLDESQRAVVAAKALPLFEEEARRRQRAGTLASNEAKGKSAEKAANLLNVSRPSVERATKVLKANVPELTAAVEARELPVSVAAKVAAAGDEDRRQAAEARRAAEEAHEAAERARREADERRALAAALEAERQKRIEAEARARAAEEARKALEVERRRREERQHAKEARRAEALERARKAPAPAVSDLAVIEGDAFAGETMARVQDASLDLVLTDPPYATRQPGKVAKMNGEVQDFDLDFDVEDGSAYVAKLAGLFQSLLPKLKPDANVVVFFDRLRLGALADALTPLGLRVRGTFYWVKPNPAPHARGGLWSGVEAALWCTHGKAGIDPAYDGPKLNYLEATAPGGKERCFHACQKPVALFERLVRLFSPKGGAVLDPFAGVLTTGVAARAAGRKATLIEINPDYVALGRGRLAA